MLHQVDSDVFHGWLGSLNTVFYGVQLDTLPSQLDLCVFSPQVLEGAAYSVSHQITRFVESLAVI
jgi:hypothetical protein